jgi:threonine aldolase
MIDLRSDTVTRPSLEMRAAMAEAPVGDDVYGEDPTVNELESTAAKMLGKAAALFVPSGTQSNLLALLSHCGRGDEYIVGQSAHTYRLEGGGAAVLGGIQPQPLDMQADGTLNLAQVAANIKPDDFHFAKTKLLCLENTTGGISLSLDYIQTARALADQHHLSLHLDGARFFNAAIDRSVAPIELAAPFHSVSICLSKGLGAPVGSVLVGPDPFIRTARRWRKMVGGGMRQAGIIAAGGLYALRNNVDRLAEDHRRAEQLARVLAAKFGPDCVVQATNMLHLSLAADLYNRLREHLAEHGIRVDRPRWVLHLDVDDQAATQIAKAIEQF